MGSLVTLSLPEASPEHARREAERVRALFEEAEQRFSRFRHDSELARLQRAGGPFVASRAMFEMVARSQRYVRATGGLFEPGIGGALAAFGYDRSFAPGLLDRDTPAVHTARSPTLADATLDPATRTITLPAGLTLDLGGIVKGATVDHVADTLTPPFALDAGGDVRLDGRGPDDEGWVVDVEDPHDAERVVLSLRVGPCAVATSATTRRRWKRAGVEAHHLIDPRVAKPAETDLAQVTVFARRAAHAEVLAKVAIVLGMADATRWIEAQPAVAAVLIGRDGAVRTAHLANLGASPRV